MYFFSAITFPGRGNPTDLGVLPAEELARRLSEYYAVEYGQALAPKALQDALEAVSETFG